MGGLRVLPIGPGSSDLGVPMSTLQDFALAELDWSNISSVICGINPGWDQAVALAALDLHKPVELIVPYFGWEEKFSKNIQKTCKKLYEESICTTSMEGREQSERSANLEMVNVSDVALILDLPGWSNDRLSIAIGKKLKLQYLWKAFKEAC